MTTTREFATQELEDMGLPWDCEWKQQVGSTRWTEVWHGVFEYEGTKWLIRWEVGLTEYQEIDPWDNEGNSITATKAEPYQHTETRWRPAQGDAA